MNPLAKETHCAGKYCSPTAETCFELFIKNTQHKFKTLVFLVQLLQTWTGYSIQEVRKDTAPKM